MKRKMQCFSLVVHKVKFVYLVLSAVLSKKLTCIIPNIFDQEFTSTISMAQFSQQMRAFLNRRSIKYGLPFLVLMVGGSFGLREFAQLRYQFSRVSAVRPEELEKYGIEMKKPGEVTIETEFEKIKNLDIDNWEQVRGPRPWEEKIEH